jgi:hypothetical protein
MASLKKEPTIRNYTKGSSGSLLGRVLPFLSGADSSSIGYSTGLTASENWDKVPLALME